mmetsp:Transcript_83288/g.201931  ORF Transcript_83288/g.201931 Transcript_83288/m.201931 type:complete len:424 (-) Transcript_83288:290-1561(-)
MVHYPPLGSSELLPEPWQMQAVDLSIVPGQVFPVPLVVCDVACPLELWHAPDYEVYEQQFPLGEYDQQDLIILPSREQPRLVPDLQLDGTLPASQKTAARRRQRKHRAHRRAPPVLRLPMPSGTSACSPSSLCTEQLEPSAGQDSEEKNCAEILEGLEAGGQAQAETLASLCCSVRRLALAPDGCRAVQAALEVAPREAAEAILGELRGHVREAVESPHANYVIQKAVEVVPGCSCGFIVEELCGIGSAVARHRYGCRVLCRLLEHAAATAGLAQLVDEVLEDAADLCRHPFAHHVMQAILEHGAPGQKSQVYAVLYADIYHNAQHRCASHLVEAALLYCSAAEQSTLAAALLSPGPEAVVALAQSQFGSFVVRVLLRLPGDSSQIARGYILQAAEGLWATRYGQRVMADLVETPSFKRGKAF